MLKADRADEGQAKAAVKKDAGRRSKSEGGLFRWEYGLASRNVPLKVLKCGVLTATVYLLSK